MSFDPLDFAPTTAPAGGNTLAAWTSIILRPQAPAPRAPVPPSAPVYADAYLAGVVDRPKRPALVKGFAGIDPGLTGYVGVVSRERRVLSVAPCPAVKDGKKGKLTFDRKGMHLVACRLREIVEHVVIEKQQVMPGNGANGNFTTGFGYGLWVMALEAAGFEPRSGYSEVAPVTWKAAMGIMPERTARTCACQRVKRGRRMVLVHVCAENKARREKNREEGAERAIELASTCFVGFDSFDLRRTNASGPSADMAVALLLAELNRRNHEAAA